MNRVPAELEALPKLAATTDYGDELGRRLIAVKDLADNLAADSGEIGEMGSGLAIQQTVALTALPQFLQRQPSPGRYGRNACQSRVHGSDSRGGALARGHRRPVALWPA